MTKRKPKPRAGQGKRRPVATRHQQSQLKAARVLTSMRTEGLSLSSAAREEGVSPATVLRHAKTALRKTSTGRYKARKTDRLLRSLIIPTSEGLAEIATADSRAASIVGEYWNAVNTFLDTGDDTALARFQGVSIRDAHGNAVRLLTDVAQLEHLGSFGMLSFESIYARAS